MARETLKKAGSAATEAAARVLMPWFDDAVKAIREDIRTLRVDMQGDLRKLREEMQDDLRKLREDTQGDLRKLREEMHTEIRTLDVKVDDLRTEVVDRSERLLATVNEVSHRVTRLDGRLEGHVEALRLNLQVTRPSRKRRAS